MTNPIATLPIQDRQAILILSFGLLAYLAILGVIELSKKVKDLEDRENARATAEFYKRMYSREVK